MKKAFLFLLLLLFPMRVRAVPLLVNAAHPLDEEASRRAASELVPISYTRADGRATQRMQKDAAAALDRMLSAAHAAGFSDLDVTSAYRSRAEQARLFEDALRRCRDAGCSEAEALARVSRYHARPGESEHETGLAVDLHNLSAASVSFAETEAYAWLCENAAEYGFILRYPKGKETITGIAFEPWHFRYVGRADAMAICAEALTLEEYVARKNPF